MISFKVKGSFDKTTKFLGFIYRREFLDKLDEYGRIGVEALSRGTPVDSGVSAESWDYGIKTYFNKVVIYWTNSNTTPYGTPIVILVEYGHSAGGTYVQGKDFINPAIQPVFDYIAEDIWKEVVRA